MAKIRHINDAGGFLLFVDSRAMIRSFLHQFGRDKMSDLLSTKQVSERFGFSKAWLERQRWLGTGPKYVKLGRMVKYRVADIEQYLIDCEVSPGILQNGA